MLIPLLLTLALWGVQATISPLEALFICKYDGIPGFPVPCNDSTNACAYTGILCVAQNGTTWNETIVSLHLGLSFVTPVIDVLPIEVGNLLSLSSLTITTNDMPSPATLPTQIGLCTQLTSLTLLRVWLTGTIPTELFAANQLSKLVLGFTGVGGTLPSEVASLTLLTHLSLGYNALSGTLPASSLSGLTLLQMFDVRANDFTGTLPDLSAWSALVYFIGHHNHFTGNVPAFTSPTLVLMDLSFNALDGTLPSSAISCDASAVPIKYVVKVNSLTGTIPSGLFCAPLYMLDLSYNYLSGSVPAEVMNAGALEQLILNHNELSGSLPAVWTGFTFDALFNLGLDYNRLSGSVPAFMMGARGRLSVYYEPHIQMNLHNNAFSGALPAFTAFPTSASLDFSYNALTLAGDSLGDTTNISWLNMANNPVKELPLYFFFRFQSLVSLDLSYCQISGTLPLYIFAQYVKLNNNYFTGVLPTLLVVQQDPTKLPVFIDVRLNRLDSDSEGGLLSNGLYGDIVLTDFPQDVDECRLGTHACEYLCVDGWFPVPGYTCDCPSGYTLDEVAKRNCTAVCGDGLLRYPEEQCDYEYSVVGCARNCTTKPGYTCDAAGCRPICGDGLVLEPEECDNQGPGCSANCRAVLGYTCSVTDNVCQPCAQSWQPFLYAHNLRLFPHLRGVIGDDLTDFDFASCLTCDDGVTLQTRAVLAAKQCLNMSAQRTLPCSFACSNLTVFGTAAESVYTLQQELVKNGFLQQLFRVIFNMNITINGSSVGRRRVATTATASNTEELRFTLSPCVGDKTAVMQVLRALALDIVPNLPALVLLPTQCGVTLTSTNPPLADIVFSVVLVGCVALFVGFLCVCGALIYYYRSSELHALPYDVSYSFLDQRKRPWAWEFTGNSKSGYYSRVYRQGSEDYRKVESLLSTHFKKGRIQIAGITAVYNPALSTSFVNQWRVMTTRKLHSSEMFFARTYTKDVAKMAVMDYFDRDLLQFTPYNRELTIPLIPVLHGTDYVTSEMIARTGFAALSSLDEGFFGKGIYFTTSLPYTLPYALAKKRPTVIVSYVNAGNVWPVTEEHKGPRSLKGGAIKSGYNSHIALTNKGGTIYHADVDDTVCDEIVIAQESQILPAFLIELSADSCLEEFEKWSRVLPVATMTTTTTPSHATNDSVTVEMEEEEEAHAYVVYDI